jgi:riboflavin kinase/FMN adenylyltransferase
VKIYRDIEDFKNVDYPVVTIGSFDGVHCGHKKIINRLTKIAKEKKGETVLIIFSPHPRIVLYPEEKNLKLINTIEEKIKILQKLNIDHLIILPFTKNFSRISPTEFVKNFLVEKIHTKRLITGYNHSFGNNREGDIKCLEKLSNTYGFEVEEIPTQVIKNVSISSTKIRNALYNGDIKKANSFLGYKYFMSGKVVSGNRIGRTINVPTANIIIEDEYKLIPAKGVYAVEVLWKEKKYNGMINIGTKPTLNSKNKQKNIDFVNNKKVTIEVNIFDFEEDIYQDYLTIYFIDKIRDEKKFKDLNSLKRQLMIDKKNSLEILRVCEKITYSF